MISQTVINMMREQVGLIAKAAAAAATSAAAKRVTTIAGMTAYGAATTSLVVSGFKEASKAEPSMLKPGMQSSHEGFFPVLSFESDAPDRKLTPKASEAPRFKKP
jgi:hypothetical protein